MTRSITALFNTAEQAERAAYDLATRVGGVRGEVYAANRASELSSLAIPGEDAAALHEHVRRGGAVLHAEVPDDRFEVAADVLEAAGAENFDERETAWRSEGWTAASATEAPVVTGDDTTMTATTGSTSTAAPVSGTTPAAISGATRRDIAAGGEETIPVIEERLRVGKRETSHGRIRVRSYVVETPVQEQVTLREERVDIERRPVDRPVGTAEDALFRERVIEVTETAEEAVVAKEARVTEEVVIRKQVEERTETVSETVRRTEVEVEDERASAAHNPTQSTPPRSNDPG